MTFHNFHAIRASKRPFSDMDTISKGGLTVIRSPCDLCIDQCQFESLMPGEMLLQRAIIIPAVNA